MQDLKTRLHDLDAMIGTGEMVEAVGKFYSDDCSFQEGNQAPRTGGKKGHAEYLTNFFKGVTKVNGLTLRSQAIGDGVTMSEWTFDLATKDGPILWNEVLRRRWKNGMVVSERFYTAT